MGKAKFAVVKKLIELGFFKSWFDDGCGAAEQALEKSIETKKWELAGNFEIDIGRMNLFFTKCEVEVYVFFNPVSNNLGIKLDANWDYVDHGRNGSDATFYTTDFGMNWNHS